MAGVPAGRLSIEIVAEIARLQQDLDKAKRAVAGASGDIAKSAMHANDSLAGMGRAMGNVGRSSNAMRANMINLGRQVQDVGTMFAMGANPMQIFTSQAAQIGDVLMMMRIEAAAANTSLTRMAAGGLVKIGPYALAAGAGALALAAAMQTVTDEINENSQVTVTWQDTALGAMDAVAAFARDEVTAAFQDMGVDVGAVWQWLTTAIGGYVNQQIGNVVFAVNMMKAAWSTFPGAVAEYFINAVNAGIRAMQDMVNRGIGMLNAFTSAANNVFNTSIGQIGQVSFGQIENSFRGAGARAGEAMGQASARSYRNYVGGAAEFIAPFAEARARARIDAAAGEAGAGAGRAMGRAAGRELQREIEDALKEAARAAAELEEIIAGKNAQAARDEADAARNLQNKVKAEVATLAELHAQIITDFETSIKERWGTMDEWLAQVNLNAEGLQMAFEQIRMDGLDSLTDGLVDVMTGFRSLGDVARSVLSQILSDMLRLQIQQSIMGPLSQALGMMGSAGAGPSAGLLGSVTQAFAANPGLFAKGTLSAPAGLAIVGEQGPELVNLRGGERIYPAGQTQQMLGTSNTINVNVSGAMNPQQARETGDQIGRRIRQQMNGRAA